VNIFIQTQLNVRTTILESCRRQHHDIVTTTSKQR